MKPGDLVEYEGARGQVMTVGDRGGIAWAQVYFYTGQRQGKLCLRVDDLKIIANDK